MHDESPESTPESETELDEVRAKLEASERELNNYKLRLADFDNARKRLLRDAETDRMYAAEALSRDLLPVLDNLDRALAASKNAGEDGPLAAGVAATVSQFLDALKRHGITRVEVAPGSEFDPNLHQAVMQQPSSDFEPGRVVQVLQHGFLIHERVLRPASVIVASE